MNDLSDRREEEKDRRRHDILDAAEAVAAVVGIGELTMEQVARKARLSRALLYVYFKDKTDLHLGLCERGISLLRQRFEQVSAEHALGLDRLTAMGRAYVEFSREFPVYFDAMSHFEALEADGGGQPAPTPATAAPAGPGALEHSGAGGAFLGASLGACMLASGRLYGIMVAAIEAGFADGSVAREAGPPMGIAMALSGFMHGVIQLGQTKGPMLAELGLSPEQLVTQALALSRRGLAVQDPK